MLAYHHPQHASPMLGCSRREHISHGVWPVGVLQGRQHLRPPQPEFDHHHNVC